MKILVAGTGFIGSKLVERLEQEHRVKTLDRNTGDYQQDITKDFKIEEEFDVVFHTIGLAPGMNSEEAYRQVHVKGTENLLNAVKSDKIIYISALKAGEIPHSFFQTKKQAEKLVKNDGRDYTILRPSTVYGEGNKLMEMIRTAAPLRVFPNIKTETQPIHIDDLTEILAKSTEEFDGETLEAAGPEKMNVAEMARKIYAEEGFKCLLLPAPRFLQETGLKILPFSGPFSRENIYLLRQQNTVENNDAARILESLTEI
ncbi:NAD-dependent epimerase/dehydratase family protein [Candidatus Nanohalobium constans]|uniref:NADH dehydrogenase (Ubiquinone) 1 alpha subcomplex, subunit 9 n=1 Tax=Candidatus Nanohalobium constans TaxID=2565781 RepID=A0A5Q0UHN2_9ARCH|nr:NAD-dependent epimerase/dehydratase family protein [Candidatus Nanohalobium constans]QGA80861.1 NADH dehydrogenase (ubiquinone) 1 alpha subcomplex, subunit 9 [Candidatus Nanohalobium constans]